MQAAAGKVVAQETFLIENVSVHCSDYHGITGLFQVCKNGDFEVGGCSVGVVLWWAQMADLIYNSANYVKGICHHMSQHECPGWDEKAFKTLVYREPQDADCESCKSGLVAVADGINCPENMEKVVEMLQGPDFCLSGIANEEGEEICQNFVKDFIPAAAKALSDDMVYYDAETCSEVFGVC